MEKKRTKYSAKNFLTQLKKILKANKITKKEFAEGIGIAPQTVHKWYSTKTNPDWANYLYRSIKYLYYKIPNFEPLQLFDFTFDENEVNRHIKMVKLLVRKENRLKLKIEKLQKKIKVEENILYNTHFDVMNMKYNSFEVQLYSLEKYFKHSPDYKKRKRKIKNELFAFLEQKVKYDIEHEGTNIENEDEQDKSLSI